MGRARSEQTAPDGGIWMDGMNIWAAHRTCYWRAQLGLWKSYLAWSWDRLCFERFVLFILPFRKSRGFFILGSHR